MSDLELIKFLWKLLYDDIMGETPSSEDLDKLVKELTIREILDGEFPY
jgi:hypothetical protein